MDIMFMFFGIGFIIYLFAREAYISVRTSNSSHKYFKESLDFNMSLWNYDRVHSLKEDLTPQENEENCRILINSYSECYNTNSVSAEGFDELFGLSEKHFKNIRFPRENSYHIIKACNGEVVSDVYQNLRYYNPYKSEKENSIYRKRILSFIDWINKQIKISGNFNPNTEIIPIPEKKSVCFTYKNEPKYKY